MDTDNLFALPSALSSDGGSSNAGFKRITANRNYGSKDFSNGVLSFEFINPMHRWWVPNRSGFRMRLQYGLKGQLPNTWNSSNGFTVNRIMTRGDGRPMRESDGISLAQNVGDHMFQSAEYQINGETANKIYQHMPQIGALRRRINNGTNVQKGMGRCMNFEQFSMLASQKDTTKDGFAIDQLQSCRRYNMDEESQVQDLIMPDVADLDGTGYEWHSCQVKEVLPRAANPDDILVDVYIGLCVSDGNGSPSVKLDGAKPAAGENDNYGWYEKNIHAYDVFEIRGQYFQVTEPRIFNRAVDQFTIRTTTGAINDANKRVWPAGWGISVRCRPVLSSRTVLRSQTATTTYFDVSARRLVSQGGADRFDLISRGPPLHDLYLYKYNQEIGQRQAYKEVELWFQLPMPIFDHEHGMPGGKHSFVLNPHTQQQLCKSVFRSLYNEIPVDNMLFDVKEFYFMAWMLDGKEPDQTTLLLDFKHIRMQQVTNINVSGAITKNIDVRPTTSALAIAFQDTRCTNSNLFHEAEFKSYLQGGPLTSKFNIAHALSRYSLEYAGQQYPVPDADLDLKDGLDHWTQAWLNTIVSNGSYFLEHPEDLIRFMELGPYFFHITLRPGMDRSTRVAINTQWDTRKVVRPAGDPLGQTLTDQDFQTLSMLVFDIQKQAIIIQLSNGQYSKLRIEEQ